jgi:hypothetical protein
MRLTSTNNSTFASAIDCTMVTQRKLQNVHSASLFVLFHSYIWPCQSSPSITIAATSARMARLLF